MFLWLRHGATNQKMAGSIPDGVSGNFYLHNLWPQPQLLTEISARNISWG